MANLFLKQAKQYSQTRPGYPQQLFDFIASKTPTHDLVWDVGTGSGQAATSLASIYRNVIGTDTSEKQLQFAPKLPSVCYECTSPNISMSELETKIGKDSSFHLVKSLKHSIGLITKSSTIKSNGYSRDRWRYRGMVLHNSRNR